MVLHQDSNSDKTREELVIDEIKTILKLERIREECPTCVKARDGTFDKQGISCVLHNNPDVEKYYCHCADSPTQGERIAEVLKRYEL